MGTVAVIGEDHLVQGFALCGAIVLTAGGAEEVRRAWHSVPKNVDVVIVTRAAAAALGERDPALRPLVAVMPA